MSDEYLIKNTTREQREEIVRRALSAGDDACDGGAGLPGEEFYQPYIDGKLEINELNQQFQAHYISEDGPDESAYERRSCVM